MTGCVEGWAWVLVFSVTESRCCGRGDRDDGELCLGISVGI
jgi:hypothetical protein